jgi:cytochrome c peroxidase
MNAGKVVLGSRLYFDTRLSVDDTVSCSTCHDPSKGFADGKTVAEGVNGAKGTRNSPTSQNAAYNSTQFWDGRAPSLEEQAKGPLVNPVEMGMPSLDAVVSKLKGIPDYVDAFERVFGTRNFTIDHVVKAIAAFERTLLSGNSDFDRFQYARQFKSLNPSARRGLELFHSKAKCQTCHTFSGEWATFTDNRFHNLGVGMTEDVLKLAREAERLGDVPPGADPGLVSELGRFVVTKNPDDIGAFKTPTLRNIALTAPYMHDGSQATLKEVIEFYNKGGHRNPYLSKDIVPLKLDAEEKADLVEFMRALTDAAYKGAISKAEE